MEKFTASIILFYDKHGNILLQDRREMSKYGEEYGFFGGKIEEGETPEQAIKREVKEELSLNLKDFSFYKFHTSFSKLMNLDVERYIYLAPLPIPESLDVKEGKPVFMSFQSSFSLKVIESHVDILKEIYHYLKKNKLIE